MAASITHGMRRERKAAHQRRRSPATNLQRAIISRTVGTHQRTEGDVAHRPGRSKLGADWTHVVHLCPGRCGVPVAHDMDRCPKHRKRS